MSEREAISAAIVELVTQSGFARLKLSDLCERAGVDEATFARYFESLEDCYLRTFEAHAERFDAIVRGAFEREGNWRGGLRAAAYAAATFIEENPRVVRFGVTAMFAVGERAQLLREQQQQGMVDLIDAGRAELDDPSSMSRASAEVVFGAVYQTLVRELEAGASRSAGSFVPDLMYVAVRPYLGHAAAFEELYQPPPERE